ncbi:endonuclease [Moraxella caviae]|uniref:Endonuclease n=1 Tax=Moraxella caviae TaxID=34060 RepID=A0A1S9ZT84_9GAMM|nr:YqaJ viral recombinase family protein [Moraxella caviae]OOR86725.1 endonuclease [Moraxella caviae]STZ13574.1 putative phage-type endonuclease [Moraxella caviae]
MLHTLQTPTKEMTHTDWLKARQTGIGGSDIAAIMGVSPYKTAYDIYLDKVVNIDGEQEINEAAYWGNVLEDVVAKEYAKRNDVKVQRVNYIIRSPEYPFAIANIDRAVVNPEISGSVRVSADSTLSTDRLLEIKTSSAYLSNNWGDENTDVVPDHYLLQCQWYMGITKTPKCDLAVLIGGNKYQQYTIDFDAELFTQMIEAARDFWLDLENGICPDPTSIKNIRHKYKKAEPGTSIDISEDEQAIEIVSKFLDLKDAEKDLNSKLDEAKNEIALLFKDKESLVLDGKSIMTYKNQVSNRLDSTKLKKDMPEIVAQYMKQSQSRVLRVAA